MPERVHEVTTAVGDVGELGSVPEMPNVTDLVVALDDAATSPSVENAGRINAVLSALQPSEAAGRLLLGVLADGSLTQLVDRRSVSCRAEAVRALLRLGFPWALEIDPDTLAWFRAAERPTQGRRAGVGLAAVIVLSGGLGAFWLMRPAATVEAAPPKVLAPVALEPAKTSLDPGVLPREAGAVQASLGRCLPRGWPGTNQRMFVTINQAGSVASTAFDPPGSSSTAVDRSVWVCAQSVVRSLSFRPESTETELIIPLAVPR